MVGPSNSRRMPWLVCAVVAVVGFTAAACGSQAGAPTTGAPLPAGSAPSEIAKMVCQPKAQHEIDEVLGVTSTIGTPAWSNHRYSCRYGFANGAFSLSVKELSSWGQTLGYYRGFGSGLASSHAIYNLGQGAFQASNGSVVVRKDWKVLVVDVSSLPPQFGNPSAPADNIALTVANVILGCWHGD